MVARREETVESNPHETDAAGGESSGVPNRLYFNRIEDRIMNLSAVDANGLYAPLGYGPKGWLIAQMQQNLKHKLQEEY